MPEAPSRSADLNNSCSAAGLRPGTASGAPEYRASHGKGTASGPSAQELFRCDARAAAT